MWSRWWYGTEECSGGSWKRQKSIPPLGSTWSVHSRGTGQSLDLYFSLTLRNVDVFFWTTSSIFIFLKQIVTISLRNSFYFSISAMSKFLNLNLLFRCLFLLSFFVFQFHYHLFLRDSHLGTDGIQTGTGGHIIWVVLWIEGGVTASFTTEVIMLPAFPHLSLYILSPFMSVETFSSFLPLTTFLSL